MHHPNSMLRNFGSRNGVRVGVALFVSLAVVLPVLDSVRSEIHGEHATFHYISTITPQNSVRLWLGWQDSNLRMPGSKPGALPLGDTPIPEDSRTGVRALMGALFCVWACTLSNAGQVRPAPARCRRPAPKSIRVWPLRRVPFRCRLSRRNSIRLSPQRWLPESQRVEIAMRIR